MGPCILSLELPLVLWLVLHLHNMLLLCKVQNYEKTHEPVIANMHAAVKLMMLF